VTWGDTQREERMAGPMSRRGEREHQRYEKIGGATPTVKLEWDRMTVILQSLRVGFGRACKIESFLEGEIP
jgi:hypothetical protein